MRRLSMDPTTLRQARQNLVYVGLIAFKKPLYQVLSLEEAEPAKTKPLSQPISLEQILKKALGGVP